jgi:ABC-type bacteriocin/lantibiotic exporter with double-glycine peptidase domain
MKRVGHGDPFRVPVFTRAALLLPLLALSIAAPACYRGSARAVSPAEAAAATRDPSWQIVDDVLFVPQQSERDCGPAALAMVLSHFGAPTSLQEVTARVPPEDLQHGAGVRAGTLRDVARAHGLQAFVVSGTLKDLLEQVSHGRPVLVGLAKPMLGGRAAAHYEVVVGMNRERKLIRSLDPARGLRENTLEGFAREWVPTHQVTIIVLPPQAGIDLSPEGDAVLRRTAALQ